MSTPEDEIKVDLDAADGAAGAADDKKGTPEAKVEVLKAEPAADDTKTTVVTADEGIEKLKKQLEDEKNARIAAESRAKAAAEGEVAARTESQENQLHLLTNAIATVKQSNDALKKTYAAALAAQDFEAAAEAQLEMSSNSAKLLQLETGKQHLEKAPKPVLRAPADPVEQFAGQLTPRSAAWVRAHPEYVRDAAKNRKMLAAHAIALADGFKVDTDEYFLSIEETLRITRAAPTPAPAPDPKIEVDDPTKDAAQASGGRTRAAPAAAPVSRGGTGNGSRPNVGTLTREEAEMAAMMGQTNEEYYKNKMLLKKEGRLN